VFSRSGEIKRRRRPLAAGQYWSSVMDDGHASTCGPNVMRSEAALLSRYFSEVPILINDSLSRYYLSWLRVEFVYNIWPCLEDVR